MAYIIEYSDGTRSDEYETYDEAVAKVGEEYAEIGHDGDLTSGGDRTLFWLDLEAAENDGGARAAGAIREVQS